MDLSRAHSRIVEGGADGWARPVRALLRLAERPYAAAVARRNARFDRHGPRLRLPVPVISVGNITVGGTGKTPLVIALVEMLRGLGRRPAVVARGYKARRGRPNDEELLIRARCREVIYAADADRCRAADAACRQQDADVVVLDDGFQHRPLGRDLDLVLVDAMSPFGHDHLLPRGLLREPLSSLSRADAVVLTRSDQVPRQACEAIEARIREFAPRPPILRARHRVRSIDPLDDSAPSPLSARELADGRVVLFAGIARPEAFVKTVEQLGIRPVGTRWFADHHAYRRTDIEKLVREFPAHDWLLTTEKDAVKLASLGLADTRIAVVRIEIDFVPPGDTMLRTLVKEVLGRHRP